MATSLVNMTNQGMPLIGAVPLPIADTGTGEGGAFPLCKLKPMTATSQSYNDSASPYQIYESDFGLFVVPPVGAFDAAASTADQGGNDGNLSIATTIGLGGPQSNLETSGTATSLTATSPIWGTCLFQVSHPRINKSSFVLIVPDNENCMAAVNCFNASYFAGWQNLFGCFGNQFSAVHKVTATNVASYPYAHLAAQADNKENAGPIVLQNMRNFGQIALAQVDNGSMTFMAVAGPTWPCYGMRVRFLVFNPPASMSDWGVGNSYWALNNDVQTITTANISQFALSLNR